MTTSIVLYFIALVLTGFAFIKDAQKTKKSLLIAWRTFLNLLPSILSIMLFVGISLAIIEPKTVSALIGKNSGVVGVIIALIVGSIAMIPSFVAFPLAGTLLKAGAGYPQVAAFVSTVMGVGIVTLPTEIKYFNKTIALTRIILTFVICVIFTAVIWKVM